MLRSWNFTTIVMGGLWGGVSGDCDVIPNLRGFCGDGTIGRQEWEQRDLPGRYL
jgi:hypothetical protein